MRRLFAASAILWTALAINGCKQEEPVTVPIPVETITFDQASITIEEGQTARILFTITPTNATEKLVWSSGDYAVASVDNTGLVTAVREGQTMIKAANTDGSKFSMCQVTVTYTITDDTDISSKFDADFAEALEKAGYVKDKSRIRHSEVKKVTELSLPNAGLSSVTGLEYFENLQKLDVSNNNLTTLSQLYVTYPAVKYLDLNYLDCSYNQLQNLEIDKVSRFEKLAVDHNPGFGGKFIIFNNEMSNQGPLGWDMSIDGATKWIRLIYDCSDAPGFSKQTSCSVTKDKDQDLTEISFSVEAKASADAQAYQWHYFDETQQTYFACKDVDVPGLTISGATTTGLTMSLSSEQLQNYKDRKFCCVLTNSTKGTKAYSNLCGISEEAFL